jgi:hypothetical protein
MTVKFVALAMIAAGIVCVLGASALDGRSPVDEGLFLLASTLGFGGIIAFGMGGAAPFCRAVRRMKIEISSDFNSYRAGLDA